MIDKTMNRTTEYFTAITTNDTNHDTFTYKKCVCALAGEHTQLKSPNNPYGFENVLDDKFQTGIVYYQIDGLYRRHKSLN